MAWNPSPKVAEARDIAQRHGMDKVIIVMIDEAAGGFDVVSYGKTKAMCRQADGLGKHLHRQTIAHYEGM